jgi:hypothetical protein
MSNRIQYRRDTRERWFSINPVLMEGEVGYETDTHCAKVGDGIHVYSELEYENSITNSNITQETGDSMILVMSQKAVTDELNKLKSLINNSDSGTTTSLLNINVSGQNPFFVGSETKFTISSKCYDDSVSSITLYLDDSKLVSEDSAEVTCETSITASKAKSYVFKSIATINGSSITKTSLVYSVNPCYIGGGNEYKDIMNETYKLSARRSPAGTYNVKTNSEDYMFFIIPSEMSINKVTMSGFDIPIILDSSSLSGYKIYVSSETYESGTWTIVIS